MLTNVNQANVDTLQAMSSFPLSVPKWFQSTPYIRNSRGVCPQIFDICIKPFAAIHRMSIFYPSVFSTVQLSMSQEQNFFSQGVCTENICGPQRTFSDDLHWGLYSTPPSSETSRIASLAVFGPFGSILGLVEVGVGARCA